MSPAGNGSGSHFGRGPAGGSSSDTGSFEFSSPVARGNSVFPGGADDATQAFRSLSFESPNGSHATPGTPFEPAGPRRGAPSDTDVFLAVAAQGGAAEQPSLTPASNSMASPQPSASRQAACAAPATGPINPLVAARTARSGVGAASPDGSGLFPIQEVDPRASKSFDTSFNEGGRKKTVLIVILVVLAVALIFAGAFFGLRYKEAADARVKIGEAIELLRSTDGVVVPLDAALSSEMSTGFASDSLAQVMLQSASASTSLSSAEQLANDADRSRDVLEEADRNAIDAVKGSVSARRSLLEVGRMLVSASSATDEALNSLVLAYGSIEDAATRIQAAQEQFDAYNAVVAEGGDTGGYDLWALVQLDNDAVADITEAQGYVASAKEFYPDADLSVLDAYLAARLSQLTVLTQIDTAIANGDMDTAIALNEQYGPLDAAQQEAYLQVPATAAELLSGAYAQSTSAQREAYAAAREKCVAADAAINGYLGISDKSKGMGLAAGTSAQPAAASVTDSPAGAPTVSPVVDGSATQDAAPAGDQVADPAAQAAV